MTKNFQAGDVVRVFVRRNEYFDTTIISPAEVHKEAVEREGEDAIWYYCPGYDKSLGPLPVLKYYCELVSRSGYELSLVEKARLFARTRHHGQFRRGSVISGAFEEAHYHRVPYFTHCEKVASLVDTDFEKTVAYCHDLIEDGKATREEISEYVHEEAARECQAFTRKKDEDYNEYVKRLMKYSQVSRVKIADIVANLSDSPTEEQVVKYNKALRILAGV